MYSELKIGGVKVPLLSNAATPLRYKQFFHKDILKEMQGASDDSAKITDSLPELTFIMAKQAQAKAGKCDMNMLKESDFIDWHMIFQWLPRRLFPSISEMRCRMWKPKKKRTKIRKSNDNSIICTAMHPARTKTLRAG